MLFELGEHEYGAELRSHAVEDAVEQAARLAKLGEPFGIGRRHGMLVARTRRIFGMPPRLAPPRRADAHDGAEEKRPLAIAEHVVETARGHDEHLLRRVVDIGFPDPEPAKAPPDEVEVTLDEQADPCVAESAARGRGRLQKQHAARFCKLGARSEAAFFAAFSTREASEPRFLDRADVRRTCKVGSRMFRLFLGSLRSTVAGALVAACGSSARPPADGEPRESASVPICSADDGSLGTAPLRRLTRFEYGRTLSDLAGVSPSVADALPPDEKSLGFEGIASAYSVSTLHASKYLEVAEGVASSLLADSARLSAFAGCDPLVDATCVEPFVRAFGRRAYRRTLRDDEAQVMLDLYARTVTPGASAGLGAVIAAMLQAPQFLYRPEPSLAGDAWGPALATRLSFMLVAAAPDAELLDAADAGELDDAAGLLIQTDRLLASPHAREAFARFLTEWWELDALPTVQKDPGIYHTWTTSMPELFGRETRAFIDAAWSDTPSLGTLLAAPVTYLTPTLASFYGLPPVSGSDFVKVELDPTRASGLLTQGSFLSVHAKANQTSPVHRGKFVREKLLCDPPSPPPPDIVVRPPTVDPRLSTRERFAQHTGDPRCAGCHVMMDPIGFLFEHYDAVGRWRDTDGGKPVDATGYLDGTDVDGDLDGVPALAERLLESEQVRQCVARQWFRHAFGREATASADTCTVGALAAELVRTNGDLRALIRVTAEQELFRSQRPEGAER